MTRERVKALLPIIQAWSEGKIVQGLASDGVWRDIPDPSFCGPVETWRIKPTSKFRPWKPEEVPVGCLVRAKKRDSAYNKYVLWSLNGDHVNYGVSGWTSLSLLQADHEHSLDHGKTWLPCGVVEDLT